MKETVKRNVRIPVNTTDFDLKKTTLLEGYELSSISVIGYIDNLGHKRMLKNSEFIQRLESEDVHGHGTLKIIQINDYFMSHGKLFQAVAQISLQINWHSGLITICDDYNIAPPIKKLNVRVTGYKYQKDANTLDSQDPVDIDAIGLGNYLDTITCNRYKGYKGYQMTQDILDKIKKRQIITLDEYRYMIDSIFSMAKEDMFMHPETVSHWGIALEYVDKHLLDQMRSRLTEYTDLSNRMHEVMDEQKTKSQQKI